MDPAKKPSSMEMFEHNGFYLIDFAYKNLAKFKNFQTRDDDVWIVSFPKSGTTWLQEIVYLIRTECDFESARAKFIDERIPYIDFPTPGIEYVEQMRSPRSIKTHLPLSLLPDNLEKKCKVIVIVRNPKDVAVSYFHFRNLIRSQGEDFQVYVENFKSGKVHYGPWWSFVDDCANKEGVHYIHYEELLKNTRQEVKRLAEYLEKKLTDEQIGSIVEWCSFEKMKTNPSVNYERFKELGIFEGKGEFMRKGQVGDWMRHFTVKDSNELDSILKAKLKYARSFDFGELKSEL